jgi:hypothetical protein
MLKRKKMEVEQMQASAASAATPAATDACQTLPYDPDAAAAAIESQWRLEDHADTQLDEEDTTEDPETIALLHAKTLRLGETPPEEDKVEKNEKTEMKDGKLKDPEETEEMKDAKETPCSKEKKAEAEVEEKEAQVGSMEPTGPTDEKEQESNSRQPVEVKDGEVKAKNKDDEVEKKPTLEPEKEHRSDPQPEVAKKPEPKVGKTQPNVEDQKDEVQEVKPKTTTKKEAKKAIPVDSEDEHVPEHLLPFLEDMQKKGLTLSQVILNLQNPKNISPANADGVAPIVPRVNQFQGKNDRLRSSKVRMESPRRTLVVEEVAGDHEVVEGVAKDRKMRMRNLRRWNQLTLKRREEMRSHPRQRPVLLERQQQEKPKQRPK